MAGHLAGSRPTTAGSVTSSTTAGRACGASTNESRGRPREPAARVTIDPLGSALGALIAADEQLLHAPVQDLGDVDFVLGRAGDLVDPAELLELLARLAQPTEHLAVKRELVETAREGVGDVHHLVRAGRYADRPGRARRLRTALREVVG